jgi:glutathione S-transferase
MLVYTSTVTLLAVLLYLYFGTRVAAARRRHGVRLPATTGHADFERVFRVQQNTLEWMPIFLPSLWLCAFYSSDAVAAGLGVVWIVGRALYYWGYAQAVEKRLPGFAIQATASIALWISAIAGVVSELVNR